MNSYGAIIYSIGSFQAFFAAVLTIMGLYTLARSFAGLLHSIPGAGSTTAERFFALSIAGAQPYPGVPPGTVVRQQPAGGFRVGAADAVALEVSQ